MPTVIDNIQIKLLDQLNYFINHATQVKTCIGYLNVKGWSALGGLINSLPPNPADPPCRVLLGMIQPQIGLDPALVESSPPDGEHLRAALGSVIDDVKAQITCGVPTKSAQAALRLLADQIRAGVVRIKVYLCHPLHAKLYLLRRKDQITPLIGYVGSSNLTYAGLYEQGELNVDVVEQDAAGKLEAWFDRFWSLRCGHLR